ncbi:LysR family transcriptional regulator [Acuticoccus sediminis]|uniref:LysR family transcriptional regulator n=1 Tax=Acuticoccus sediminis TaxID=2184697 RepID=UPI001CFCF30D|nr:LysR family transcriptional regulator [Acuticoccus sediminis]
MAVRLDLRQIRALAAIVRGGSASAAAETLAISQPAVSKIIAGMEDELGYRLFRRSGRRLAPTPEALALMPLAERVLGELDRLNRGAEAVGRGSGGQVSIAGNHTLISALAARAATRLRSVRPEISVSLIVLPPNETVTSVVSGHVDIGLSYGPLHHSQLVIEDVGAWACACVFPSGHRLEGLPTVSPRDLAGETLLTYSESSPTGAALRRQFHAEQHELVPAIILSSTPLVLDMVRNGQGVGLVDTFVPFATAYPDLSGRPLTPRIENVSKLLVSTAGAPSSAAIALAAEVRAVARALGTAGSLG